MKSSGLSLVAEEKTVSFSQFGFAGFGLSGWKNVTSDVWARKCSECMTVAATESGKVRSSRPLRSEQKANYLLRERVSSFSQSAILLLACLHEHL